MSTFKKRMEGQERIVALQGQLTSLVEDFSNKNPDLTMSEVTAVLLNFLVTSNQQEIRKESTS